MADMNSVWHYTRTYMTSNRTNPAPASYIADMRSVGLTPGEKQQLTNKVLSWPGGNTAIKNATINDINQI